MECNKDEALRAKAIAEKKLADKDYGGAKKFTLKAQTLYPGLDGISQMLTTLDVYISAENKVSGEVDWYGILGVKPADDDETIRKNYRKLALMLHPDKNKSVGADGAFKLLSEAWSLLSDKAKRVSYNQRRSMRGFQQKVPSQSGGPSAPPAANGVYNFAKRATSKPNIRSSTTTTTTRMGGPGSVPPVVRPAAPPPVVNQRSDTFWTICHRCKMHYEYLNLYLNHTLLCPNCHEPFLAKEMPPPVNLPKSSARQDSTNHAPTGRSTQKFGGHDRSNVHWGPSARTHVPCSTDPSIATKAASVVQQANDRLKREREEFYAGWPSKKRKADDEAQSSGVKIPFQMSTGNGGNLSKGAGFSNKVNRSRELTPSETRNMLMHKAQSEIRRKIMEWDTEEKSKEEKSKEEKSKVKKSKVNKETQNGNQSSEKKSVVDPSAAADEQESAMNVPDPDFHDFDLDRTENSFGDNQVWAAYDDDDGMPRFYALVHKVISRNPLKMKISWLNSKTTAEFGSFEWLGYGFRKTCGEFRIGRHEMNMSLNSFSQKVEWTKAKGIIHILPRKGQVWAVYRNWSRDWNENTPEDVIHKYDMVEVLDDYNEEKGVPVSRLVKYAGFRTVFHAPTEESSQVKVMIPKEEMFRFSHQVPRYVLTGEEGENSPKGCLELDPAATPLDLIQESNGEEEEEKK